jgi:hypothetical protein
MATAQHSRQKTEMEFALNTLAIKVADGAVEEMPDGAFVSRSCSPVRSHSYSPASSLDKLRVFTKSGDLDATTSGGLFAKSPSSLIASARNQKFSGTLNEGDWFTFYSEKDL